MRKSNVPYHEWATRWADIAGNRDGWAEYSRQVLRDQSRRLDMDTHVNRHGPAISDRERNLALCTPVAQRVSREPSEGPEDQQGENQAPDKYQAHPTEMYKCHLCQGHYKYHSLRAHLNQCTGVQVKKKPEYQCPTCLRVMSQAGWSNHNRNVKCSAPTPGSGPAKQMSSRTYKYRKDHKIPIPTRCPRELAATRNVAVSLAQAMDQAAGPPPAKAQPPNPLPALVNHPARGDARDIIAKAKASLAERAKRGPPHKQGALDIIRPKGKSRPKSRVELVQNGNIKPKAISPPSSLSVIRAKAGHSNKAAAKAPPNVGPPGRPMAAPAKPKGMWGPMAQGMLQRPPAAPKQAIAISKPPAKGMGIYNHRPQSTAFRLPPGLVASLRPPGRVPGFREQRALRPAPDLDENNQRWNITQPLASDEEYATAKLINKVCSYCRVYHSTLPSACEQAPYKVWLRRAIEERNKKVGQTTEYDRSFFQHRCCACGYYWASVKSRAAHEPYCRSRREKSGLPQLALG
jgi:hypothetical protein